MIYFKYTLIREAEMFENSCEYIIKEKNEGKALLKKLGMLAAYLLLALTLTVLNLNLAPAELRLLFFALIAIAVGLTAFITWRFVCVEYEVVIAGGELIITALYGKSISRQIISKPLNAFSEIGEYDDRAFEEISKLSMQKNYLCISSLSAPRIYYAIFEEEKERHILYFDVTDKAVDLLTKQCASAHRASLRRMNKI